MLRSLAQVRWMVVAVLAAAVGWIVGAVATMTGVARARAGAPYWLALSFVLWHGGCTCVTGGPPPREDGPIACIPLHLTRATVAPAASGVETVDAGELPGRFSLSSTGEALFVIPLVAPPGRVGVQPELAITYSSGGGGDGALGAGFSLRGASAIIRCAKNLAQDGEIRGVRFDAEDKLCLDGMPLVLVDKGPGSFEYRTVPDSFARVIGHDPEGEGAPHWFEVTAPSGLVTEYGTLAGTRPRGPGGVTRAWLAATVRDGRGNALDYGYCFAEAEDYTAEYALDEIRYTRFEGSDTLEASRAVKLVYGTKDPAGIRTMYSSGMALQASLRLDAIEMVGPGEALVRRYAMGYAPDPATSRTLLTRIEECAGDGVCKPATRFDYQRGEVGFRDRTTSLPVPTARAASPMLLDIDADGLADLVIPDTHPALSTPQNPLTQWLVAHNGGAGDSAAVFGPAALAFSQETIVPDGSGPSDPAQIQPELGTVIDYDQDGRKDVLLHDVHGVGVTWQVLLARPDRTFEVHDTGIVRPFPIGSPPVAPGLTSRGGSMHLADVNGDHVPDLIQCEDHGTTAGGDPSKPVWNVHLWRPTQEGAPFGFDPEGEPVEALATVRCDIALFTVDLDADGKVDLVTPPVDVGADGSELAGATYEALTRREDGTWETFETELPVVPPGGRLVFLDVNGDGLPDAVQSGFQDHTLYTYLNTGPTFAAPFFSLGSRGFGDQDTYFRLAATLDYNGDGRHDLLVPVAAGTLPGQSTTLPAWAILQAKAGMQGEGTFTLVDPHVPFEPELTGAVTLADPRGPRIGDLNGDGASDVVLPLGGVFHVFESTAADQDVLLAVSGGMNAHDPSDPDHVPSVSLSYGHLIDTSITEGLAVDDPAREEHLYLSRADASNECVYPRRCAVGSRRVVRAYSTDDGAGGVRRFEARYRDGRYHALGHGFLGFAERRIVDLDTLALTADFYDNATYDADLHVHPFAGQPGRRWRVSPGLPDQPDPGQIEMAFLDVTRTVVPTSGGKSHFTLATGTRLRRVQGHHTAGGAAPTTLAYVREVESGGGGATVLQDTTAKVTDFDAFGHVRAEDISTAGVDLTLQITRTFENDTDRWVLGQPRTQKVCSSAAMLSRCRILTRTTTIFGEVATESIATDDGSAETKLDVVYTRDDFGNITGITADDAFGHHRATTTVMDPEGLFPEEHINAAGHHSFMEHDPGLGVLTRHTDPNGLVTEWKYDGFGRLGLERRPDGTTTSITLSRTKDGGPAKNAWRVRQRTATTGGADDEVEIDSLGRVIQTWWHGPATPRPEGAPPRLTQQVVYDPWTGQIARRSVPVSEGTPAGELLFDVFERDAAGREVRHTTPWNAVTETSYDGFFVQVKDPLQNVTLAEHDPLGRLVTVTDAAQGITSYTYGPFGLLYTVTDPGGALLRTTRDAFGRARQVEDPDRGTTVLVHDGFGDLLSSTDALGRVITFEPDALGRPASRTDQNGPEIETTTWTWDTAPHGIGKLHELESPDGVKTYSYTGLGRLDTLTLAVHGESASLQSKLTYDPLGRVATITYPTPAGAPPFVVSQDHDAYGHVLRVRDATSGLPYWHLTDVDGAGRYRTEAFGNGTTTERTYSAAKQRLQSIVTESAAGGAAATVQSLTYDYDARLDLTSRTDALQPQHPTERFRYDALERLTCAYFSPLPDPSAPCDASYAYAPNGNLTFKSDVGVLSYDDPVHPHAVSAAGGESYGHDAAGNQTTRPAGVTVTYTPFDLPRTVTQATDTVTFGYDGDQRRIRKTTPKEETLYLGQWYERVTDQATAVVVNRYYIHSPERVVAIVTRGGPKPSTTYVHADHLGSVDTLTDEDGDVVERRSYDAFGQRRNPEWGEPPPASFAAMTSLGFTAHEGDDDLGLVNMKGRVFDPRIGRFLTTDPIISDLTFGQSLNAYSYVLNNPLTFTDPSGFSGDPEKPPILPSAAPSVQPGPDGVIDVYVQGTRRIGPPAPQDEAEQVGVAVPATDVDTTGGDDDDDPQEAPTAPEDWRENPYVQVESGFFGGLMLGLVPFGGEAHQVLDETGVLPKGPPKMRTGLAVGLIVGGLYSMFTGASGEVVGGAASATGVGASVGVPAMVVSTALVVGGAANVLAGLQGLSQSMMSSGGGTGGSATGRGPPNPYGKMGGPEHKAKVAQVAEEVKARSLKVKLEHYIKTPGGAKPVRYVDVVGRDANDNIVEMHQIGRQTKAGQPVAREIEALDDIERATGIRPIFHPYNP